MRQVNWQSSPQESEDDDDQDLLAGLAQDLMQASGGMLSSVKPFRYADQTADVDQQPPAGIDQVDRVIDDLHPETCSCQACLNALGLGCLARAEPDDVCPHCHETGCECADERWE